MESLDFNLWMCFPCEYPLEKIRMKRTFLKKSFITDIFLQCFITARISESFGEFSKIFGHRHSLRETARGRCSFKNYCRHN